MRNSLLKAAILSACIFSGAASAVVIQGEWTPGVYPNVKIDSQGRLIVLNESGVSGEQAAATNNYLALIESKLPALNNGRVPVEFTTPVAVTGSVGIAGSVAVTGTVSAALIGTPTVAIAGTPSVNIAGGNIQSVTAAYSYRNLTAAGTTVIKSGAGRLRRVTINTPGTLSKIEIYDNTAGSGAKIGTINTVLGQNSLEYDLNFNNGLVIVASGTLAADITVVYN